MLITHIPMGSRDNALASEHTHHSNMKKINHLIEMLSLQPQQQQLAERDRTGHSITLHGGEVKHASRCVCVCASMASMYATTHTWMLM